MSRGVVIDASQGLDYDVLEDALSKLHTFGGKKEFDAKLQAQVASCNKFYMSMIQDLNLANYPTSDQVLTEAIPNKLASDIVKLDEFGYQNAEILRAILTLHDKKSEFPLMPSFQWKMQRNDFCSSEALEPLLMRLSAQYVQIKRQEAREEKRDAGGIATTVFERKSIKFWIRSHDVVKVICDIVKKMPIFSFGKLNRFSQYTTSVYYDDDKLSMYSQRLVKEEDSTLIRFRWYNEMTKDTNVFVERKVHHEKWVMESSNKMRFVLPQANILGYVQGTFQASPEFIQKHPMFTEVQQRIIKQGLKPCLQTRYNRAAFQMDDDDSVRLSLDTNLMMLQESGVDTAKAWRRQENTYLEDDVHRFPFAVLEVKLHNHLLDNPPLWVEQLMEGGMLIRVDKFSKYGHGVAVLYHDKVKTLPYWLDQKFSKQISEGGSGDADSTPKKPPRRAPSFPQAEPSSSAGSCSSSHPAPSTPNTVRQRQPTRSMFDEASSARSRASTMRGDTGGGGRRDKDGDENPGPWSRFTSLCKKNDKPQIETRLRIEPKTFFASERTYMQWMNSSVMMGGIGVRYILSADPVGLALGQVLLPISIALSCYSLMVFHWRTLMLLRRQPSKTYGDRWGPTSLSIAFLAVLIWAIVWSIPALLSADKAMVVASDSDCSGSRLCEDLARCTLPVVLTTPPKEDFDVTGTTFLDNSLYISSSDGRIAVVDQTTQQVAVWNDFWLTHPLAGISVSPRRTPHQKTLYGARSSPASLVEIDGNSRTTKRVIEWEADVQPDAAGLAIVPAPNRDGLMAWVPSPDGWVSLYAFTPDTQNTTATFVQKFLPGTAAFSFNKKGKSKSATPTVQYDRGRVLIADNIFIYVYNITGDGQPVSISSYQTYPFALPDVRGLAIGNSGSAFVVTQDTQGGRESHPRILAMRHNLDAGFTFCP